MMEKVLYLKEARQQSLKKLFNVVQYFPLK